MDHLRSNEDKIKFSLIHDIRIRSYSAAIPDFDYCLDFVPKLKYIYPHLSL